jgi:hypothetical protein
VGGATATWSRVDNERLQAPGPAGDHEPGVDRVGHASAAVGEAVRLGQPDLAVPVDPDHASEPSVGGDALHRVREGIHAGESSGRPGAACGPTEVPAVVQPRR